MIGVAIDVDPNLQVMDCWKSFNIAGALWTLEKIWRGASDGTRLKGNNSGL